MSRSAVVTGAGSGVGRAVAVRLARSGWRVAAMARGREALEATAHAAGQNLDLLPCDVTDAASVARAIDRLRETWQGIDAVINAAGTNIPARALPALSPDDFRRVVEVNLIGAFNVTHACLPLMRGHDRATVVMIVSDAGLIGNAKAGASYVASKFGLTGLTESINAELRADGIRASAIFPGDIDTPLLEKRPAPPDAAARARMLQPDDVADCVMLAVDLPHRAVLEKLVVRPR